MHGKLEIILQSTGDYITLKRLLQEYLNPPIRLANSKSFRTVAEKYTQMIMFTSKITCRKKYKRNQSKIIN